MRFWNVKTGKIIRTVEKTDADRSLHSYPDNQLLIRARKPKSGNRFEFLIESLTSSPDKEVVTATVVDEKTPVVAGLSADDSRLAVTTFGKPRVLVFDTQSGRQLREVLIPGEIAELEPRYHFNSVALSRSGRYLLYYDRVYDLDAKSPNTVWQAPEHSVAFYKAGFLGDERHVVMRLGARYELWDWQENKKRLSIFLLPQEQWMVFNHETHNWNGSNFAFRHVEFLYRAANDKEEWVVPFIYEKRTQWENEPAQAGLADLRNRPVKSVSAKPSP